jgi:hypothetical protein
MIFHSLLGKIKSFKIFQKQNTPVVGAPIQERKLINNAITANEINALPAEKILSQRESIPTQYRKYKDIIFEAHDDRQEEYRENKIPHIQSPKSRIPTEKQAEIDTEMAKIREELETRDTNTNPSTEEIPNIQVEYGEQRM